MSKQEIIITEIAGHKLTVPERSIWQPYSLSEYLLGWAIIIAGSLIYIYWNEITSPTIMAWLEIAPTIMVWLEIASYVVISIAVIWFVCSLIWKYLANVATVFAVALILIILEG